MVLAINYKNKIKTVIAAYFVISFYKLLRYFYDCYGIIHFLIRLFKTT